MIIQKLYSVLGGVWRSLHLPLFVQLYNLAFEKIILAMEFSDDLSAVTQSNVFRRTPEISRRECLSTINPLNLSLYPIPRIKPTAAEHLRTARQNLNRQHPQRAQILEPDTTILNELLVKTLVASIKRRQQKMLSQGISEFCAVTQMDYSDDFNALLRRKWSEQEMNLAKSRIQAAFRKESDWKVQCDLHDPWTGPEVVRFSKLLQYRLTLTYRPNEEMT